MEKTIGFSSGKGLEKWLSKNHDKSNGIWLKVYKKGFNSNALKSTEVLDPLLCYGWITGQAKKGTEKYTLWWVCPRRKNSLWSKINVGHAERLISEGKMKPSGMKEIQEAKSDGRWDRAYPQQKIAKLPVDFMERVNKSKKAKEFLKRLSRTNVYAIIFRLHNTKDQKRREEKINGFIDMLEKGRKFY